MIPAPPSNTRGSLCVRFAPKQEIKGYAPPVVPHAQPPPLASLPPSEAEGHATSLQDGPVQVHGQDHTKDRQQQQHDRKQPSRPVRRHTKSRLGCKECKLGKVKCDQTLPENCYSEKPPGNWQVVMPLMISRSLEDPWMGEVKPDRNLLQYWPEQTNNKQKARQTKGLQSSTKTNHRCSIDTPAFNFHATPLLTAAAELRRNKIELRERAVNHFKAMYSTNRAVVNMWAIDLLREVWEYNDTGTRTTWLELLRLKDWAFTFA